MNVGVLSLIVFEMKLLLIYRVNIDVSAHAGIVNKMRSQKLALKNLGHQVDIINHSFDSILFNKKSIRSIRIDNSFQNFIIKHNTFFSFLKDYINPKEYDLIFIRYPFSNATFLSFCKSIKTSINTKLVIDMPTFPYNKEFSGITNMFIGYESFWREKLRKYIDFFIHYGPEKSISGVTCISSINGINVKSLPIRKANYDSSVLRMIAIGKWKNWHGLDRVLLGMKESLRNTSLMIVGEGSEVKRLKELVSELQIADRVRFAGVLKGKELDKAFDDIDIGIGTLGMHRKGVNYNSSLKHREYCARGLPFILSTFDSSFPSKCGFVQYNEESDLAIDLDKVSEFLEGVSLNPKEIKLYAQENLDWKVVLGEVLKRINFYKTERQIV